MSDPTEHKLVLVADHKADAANQRRIELQRAAEDTKRRRAEVLEAKTDNMLYMFERTRAWVIELETLAMNRALDPDVRIRALRTLLDRTMPTVKAVDMRAEVRGEVTHVELHDPHKAVMSLELDEALQYTLARLEKRIEQREVNCERIEVDGDGQEIIADRSPENDCLG